MRGGSSSEERATGTALISRAVRSIHEPVPTLAVGDGALGFWAAVREVFPTTPEQRCCFHKQANALASLP